MHAPLAPDYRVCEFQSGTKFVFGLHYNEISYQKDNVSGMTCTGTKCPFGNREIHEDLLYRYRMNSFQNESHSGIM